MATASPRALAALTRVLQGAAGVQSSASPIKISSGLLLKDIVGGYYYKFDGSQLTTYTDMLNGAAICKACKYMMIDKGIAYCNDGGSRVFANSSIPGMIKSNLIRTKSAKASFALLICALSVSV